MIAKCFRPLARPFTSLVAGLGLLGGALLGGQACSKSEGTEQGGAACSATEPCPSGQECLSGSCVPKTTVNLSDGGTGYNGGSVPLDDAGHGELADAACTGWSAEPEPQPAVLMLVVDVSGSMSIADPTDDSQTKWEVTQRALIDAITTLPATTSVGMLFYPNMATEAGGERDLSACLVVDAMIEPARLDGPGSEQRRALQTALETTAPDRQAGTPTHDAYVTALEALEASPAIGEKYMLLITDGQPTFLRNCNGTGNVSNPVDEQPIIDEIAGASAQGIDTFIIGSPGSEQNESTNEDARPWLSHAAEAGGTALAGCTHDIGSFCHFDMVEEESFGTGLRNALGQIAGQIVSCEYGLPAPPTGESLDPGAVNVIMTDGAGQRSLLLRDTAADCSIGWHYSADNTQVLLCEASCQTVKSDPKASLELLFGCATQEGPIE